MCCGPQPWLPSDLHPRVTDWRDSAAATLHLAQLHLGPLAVQAGRSQVKAPMVRVEEALFQATRHEPAQVGANQPGLCNPHQETEDAHTRELLCLPESLVLGCSVMNLYSAATSLLT